MQQGNIVLLGSGCDATQSGQHQVEDYCRQCGSPAGVAELVAALLELLAAAKSREYDERHGSSNHCSDCGYEVHTPDDCDYAAAIAEAERVLGDQK